jgi:hypothetical protein
MNWDYVPEHRCHALRGRECVIALYPRPPYCDRGNWYALLDTCGKLAFDMDPADCWPRYYFDLERAKLECEAWVRKRGQWTDDSSAAMTLRQAGVVR